MKITYELARAAGMDAGNSHMRAHALKAWNRDSYASAVRTINQLLLQVPVEEGGLKGLQLADIEQTMTD